MSKKKILIYIGSPLLSLVVLTATAFAINSIAEGYKVTAGATNMKVTSSSGCQTVTNSGSSDIFIPTNTANEWTAFLNNKPSYVTTGECITCTPLAPLTQTLSCPSGTKGASITQYKYSTCLSGATSPTYDANWTPTTNNNCVALVCAVADSTTYGIGSNISGWTSASSPLSTVYCPSGSQVQANSAYCTGPNKSLSGTVTSVTSNSATCTEAGGMWTLAHVTCCK